MATKLTLNTNAMEEDFFEDAALIGIVCSLPAHKFCWLLNQHFDMDFVRDIEQDICLQSAKELQHFFPVYQYVSPLNGPKYILYKLKVEKQQLLPEAKGLDYLWMVQSSNAEIDAMMITDLLRSIPVVQMAQILEVRNLKHLNHLLV